ncbi:hypothetical protein BH10CHL1_BH10CHL1_15770 [soil metagenome]
MSVFMIIVIGLAFYSIAQNVEKSPKATVMPVKISEKPVVAKQKIVQR